MKKHEIKVGENYVAKVGGKQCVCPDSPCPVHSNTYRFDRVRPFGRGTHQNQLGNLVKHTENEEPMTDSLHPEGL